MSANNEQVIENIQERISEILHVLQEAAAGNMGAMAKTTDKNDSLDALAIGVNMLLEEIEAREELIVKESKKVQIINEKLNTKNQALAANQEELHASNEELICTKKELEDRLSELERFNKLFTDREIRMRELKARIRELEEKSKK
jgi:hypothetical protein